MRVGNGSLGTAFALDHCGKQYLVTARHLLGKKDNLDCVQILHGSDWKELRIALVGISDGDPDIAVLAPEIQLAPSHPLEPPT